MGSRDRARPLAPSGGKLPTKLEDWDQNMQLPRDAMLLRIFFGEEDRCNHRPLYEAIVLKAREMHLGGATVLRGHIGFGHSSRIHTTKILRLSEDLPIVVEIVDSQEKIEAFLPILDGMMSGGLVTTEKVQVLQYGTDSPQT
jgi:PII-like signaling protein